MPVIRDANQNDAEELARLAEQTFRDTFASTNTDADMDLHAQANYSTAIQAEEIGNPRMKTFVCEENGQFIAFAQLRWEPAPDCVVASAPGEILRFYVAKDWQGRGVAQSLMDVCLTALHERGSDVVWLGVWENNPRAIAFYRKFGLSEVGDHVYSVGNDPQRDLVMARRVEGGCRDSRAAAVSML